MTLPIERDATSGRAARAKARQSRRPSRLGSAAGAAAAPDYLVPGDAGFPGLLDRTWQQAVSAPDLATAADILLTLGGHVPAHIQLRAMRIADECAVKVLCGRTWRGGDEGAPGLGVAQDRPEFLGELGLTVSGRVVLRVPGDGPLPGEEELVGGVLRVPWPAGALRAYQAELGRLRARLAESVADCRQWLAAATPGERRDMLENLMEAARRTAPFVLYHEGRQYTNFRDRNTLIGKTLWPGHPDCALSSLLALPLDLWPDSDVVMVVSLALLVRSAGFARIEEANGTQLTIDHVAYLLEQTRRSYESVPGGQRVAPASSSRVAVLADLAGALGARRREVTQAAQLYREIHGPLMHKIERVAPATADAMRRREAALCAQLTERLPVAGGTLRELGASVTASPSWLAEPQGEFATGLESLLYETVRASTTVFECDMAMSRGIRSLTALVRALRAEEWPQIAQWELPHFYCCVVPSAQAERHFGGSPSWLADTAWAISSRMQYNSWHFLVGNLPKVPAVAARDYFVPPVIPDIAYYSDQHHHGHVAAKVRFSIRSPQPVEVLGRTFNGFIDLRLLRCAGPPFDEQDMLAAHRASAFIATAVGAAAALVGEGAAIDITSFDSRWHWESIASQAAQTVQ